MSGFEFAIACILVLSGVALGHYGLRRQSRWYYLGVILLLLPLGHAVGGAYWQYKKLRASGATVSFGPGLKINVTFPTINLNSDQFRLLKAAADAGTLTAEQVATEIKSGPKFSNRASSDVEQLAKQPWVQGKAADIVVDGLIQSWPAWMVEYNESTDVLNVIFGSSQFSLPAKERLMMFLAESIESTPSFPRHWRENMDVWSMVLAVSDATKNKVAASKASGLILTCGDTTRVRAGSVVPINVRFEDKDTEMRMLFGAAPYRFSASMVPGDVTATAPLQNRSYHSRPVLDWQTSVIAPATPGKYKVHAQVEVARDRDDVYRYYWFNPGRRPEGLLIDQLRPVVGIRTITGEMEVVASDTVMDRCTHPDDTKRMAGAIKQSGQSRAYLTKNGVEVEIDLTVKPDACSLVCDVILIEGGQEFMLGTYAAVQGEETTWSMGRDGIVNAEGRSYLKFVPRPELIPYSERATRIYSGEPIQKEIMLILYGSR